ncbi:MULTISPECIES: DNA repair protein RecO [Prochlorococcus]|uniref:DNA repair protein RecO n=1 Tax=Prochlorococcus marinus (strain SARG / CCMP1375 / SS120) TaxID=167539 RepID=Q7VDI1_PROMA|nr:MULTISPECIES: DNA repair protein RecO [Prochlorococcus]AAP99441.1 Recombinational DNA repair protein RecO [Prochlorococcus marinus subsp. marinus str. CCMP1375]KGG11290.1 DNA recombination and repair protein RecO [Prochlorococcus marinus str. LG]KGG18756.1 DNA recombination and repair protein RecO [Prochlorococcus marinus str. SS2]KGG23029.1 DNA recombination and repair protein RecO [Prochlorococcus marinus str. SS35]KGG33736.1 DNA recombination and repair protein RecO [Prochlorococcus mari
MIADRTIKGLCLKVGPLGENDRLLTLLTHEEGIVRIAVPGARRPKSRLAATSALTFLELLIGGKSTLRRARQIKVIKSFSKLGEKLETLSAAQALSELAMLLVGTNDPQPEILQAVLIHLERLQKEDIKPVEALANCVQACVHLLALGGYGLPIQKCCWTGIDLIPPIGDWTWRCSLIESEGFAIGEITNAEITLNASELALLQRLLKPILPLKQTGELLGPMKVWMKLLRVIELWIETHLNRNINALSMLKKILL